jgi:hypothetical protein
MYIGNDLQIANPSYKIIDDISSGFNGSTTSFALQVGGASPVPFPINTQQVMISVNGVVQEPDPGGSAGFKLLGSNIVFSSAPANGHAFFGVIYAGADYVTAGSEFPDGTVASPSFTFESDTDTGWYRIGSGSVGFTSNGVKILDFDGNGLDITGTCTATSFAGPATQVTVADESTDTSCNVLFTTAATGNLPPKSGTNLTFNSNTGALTATSFVGALTGNVTGNASGSSGSCSGTAAIATAITIADESSDTTCFPLFATAATGDLGAKSGSNLTFNSSSGALTATSFVGALTGDVTGNVSGSAATVTGAAQSAITSLGTLTSLGISGNLTVDTNTLHVDATNNRVGIGTATPDTELEVQGATDPRIKIESQESGNKRLELWIDGGTAVGYIAVNQSASTLQFQTTSTTALTLDASQNATFAGTVSDSKGDLRTIPKNAKTGAYTITASDAGKFIPNTTGGWTIPNGVMSVGDAVTLVNDSGSDQTITQGSNHTIYNTADGATGSRTLAARGMATLIWLTSSVSYISGAGLS